MSVTAPVQTAAAKPQNSDSQSLVLQRKCACGASAGLAGECAGCQRNRLLGHPRQRMLGINEPGDEYEKEADRVAEEVLRMPDPERHEESPRLSAPPFAHQQVPGSHTGTGGDLPIVDEVLSSPGKPLDAETRTFFEPRFGHDFSRVRVHTDLKAAESARAIHALAYTSGSHVVLPGGNALGTEAGRRLLAHELTHIVQQARPLHSVLGTGAEANAAPGGCPERNPAALDDLIEKIRSAIAKDQNAGDRDSGFSAPGKGLLSQHVRDPADVA